MNFWQFSRNAYICIIPGKLSENHLHAFLFSNPCGQVLSLRDHFKQFSKNNTYMSAFLENFQESFCIHGCCSPIHVERSLSVLEFHEVRIWGCNIYIFTRKRKKHSFWEIFLNLHSNTLILTHSHNLILSHLHTRLYTLSYRGVLKCTNISNVNFKVVQVDFPIKYGPITLKHPWSISLKTLGHFKLHF